MAVAAKRRGGVRLAIRSDYGSAQRSFRAMRLVPPRRVDGKSPELSAWERQRIEALCTSSVSQLPGSPWWVATFGVTRDPRKNNERMIFLANGVQSGAREET